MHMLSNPVRSFLNPFNKSIKHFYTIIQRQILITDAFKTELMKKLQKRSLEDFLRLEVIAGQGCQGFTYKFKVDNKIEENDYVYLIQKKQNEQLKKTVGFAIRQEQLKLLNGATIDYTKQMMREMFYVKQNPNAQLSCSCGTSFSPKDFAL